MYPTQQVLSIDTETTGLEEKDRPFALSIADDTKEYYYRGDAMKAPEIGALLADPDRIWFLQNPKFDMRMLSHIGLEIKGTIYDLAVMARLERNDHLKYNLDSQAQRKGFKKMDEVAEYIKANKLYEKRFNFFGQEYKNPRYQDVPEPLMEEYAKKDARITYDIGKSYSVNLKVLHNEALLTKVCFKLERRGVLLDFDYTLNGFRDEQEIISNKKIEFSNITGKSYVNSAKSFQTVLESKLPLTDAGNPSLDDDVLEWLLAEGTSSDRIVAGLIREIRDSEKRAGTYYEAYLNAMDENHVIRASLWPAGTRTGRFSSSGPNLQNIPKEKNSTAKRVVRGCFIPRPGHVFVSYDYSQLEYRLMLSYANERIIINKIMSGFDAHQAISEEVGLPRDIAKTLNFAILYGAGDDQVAYMLGVSKEEAAKLRFKYFSGLPKVESFIDKVKKKAKDCGEIVNWFGRPLHFGWRFDPKTNKKYHDNYSAPNHLIQGGGADVIKVAMVNIDKEMPDLHMVMQIHDQLVFEVPRGTPTEKLQRIKELMENAFPEKNGMKLLVDVQWSDKSFAERDLQKGFPK